MGIRLLNTFLRTLHTRGIQRVHLEKLKGKKIVIDAFIYIYRFLAMDSLIENIYLMCSIFRHYNISPLFVFDGKSRKEKNNTLLKRAEQREAAKRAYMHHLKILETAEDEEDKEGSLIHNHSPSDTHTHESLTTLGD